MRREIRKRPILFLTAFVLSYLTPQCLAEDSKSPADNPSDISSEEIEPLDTWTPVKESTETGEEPEKKSSIVTSTKDSDEDLQGKVVAPSEPDEADEVIEIKATVSDPGLKRVDPEVMLRHELEPQHTELKKIEQKRFEEVNRIRQQVAAEQAKKLGLKRSSNSDPRGDPEITICNINANNYGTRTVWDDTFKRSDIPKRKLMRQTIFRAIQDAKCDLIAVQAILGREDNDAIQAAKELVGYKAEQQAGWKIVLGRATREVSRNLILYRNSMHLTATDDFQDSRLSMFGSFKLDKFALPPIQATFEVPKDLGEDPRSVTLISFTLKNSVSFNSEESELKRVQLAEFIRGQTMAIKRARDSEGAIVVLAGNRAGPLISVGSQILEGRFKLADFQRDGACSFGGENGVECSADRIRPKELFGVIGSSAPERVATQLTDVKIPPALIGASKAGEKTRRKRPTAEYLSSEMYLDGSDYYLGLAEPNSMDWFNLRIIPVRNGLPQSPFLALKLNW